MIKRKIFRNFIALVIIVESMFFGLLPGQRAPQLALAATTLTKTTQADFQAGKYEFNNIDTINSAGDVKLQANLGSWDASGSASLNHYIYPYNKMLMVGKFMYLFKNRGIGQFLRYDFDTREYKEMSYLPLQPYEIVDMTTNGTDTIWVFAGRTSNTNLSRYFLKYDIPTDTWTYLANTPATIIGASSSLEFVGNDTIYAIRGGGYYDLWRYTISTNSWDVIQNTTSYCQTYCDLQYDGSRYMYMATDWGAPDRLYRFDTTNRTWLQRANAPIDGSFSTAVDMVMVGDDIFTMRGASTKTFYKYNSVSNTWTTVADLPYYTYYGALAYDSVNNRIIVQIGLSEFLYYYISDNAYSNSLTGPTSNAWGTANTMTSDGAGNLYFCRGQNTTTCYKYASATNTWTTLAAAPTLGYYGNSLAYYNNAFYVNQGSNGSALYKYDTVAGTWTTSGLATSPVALGNGSNMIASGSGTLWALQPGGTGFYRYDISGNSWTTKTAIPQATSVGSGIVQAGMFTYVLQGNTRGKFWRYHETTNGWYELPSLPVGSYYGGGLTYDGSDYIYAQVGGENDIWGRQFYRYSISGNTWTRMADLPEMIRWGGDLEYYDGKIYAYQGYDGGFWKYTPPSGNTYITTGNWYSPVYDLTTASAFNTFSSTETTPSGTSIVYYSRTSTNQNTWTDWQLISGGLIGSDPRRYIQIKATLTGDGTNTPTLSDFSIDYESDSTAPDTGSISVLGYSASGGTALTTGASYQHRHPYFTWSGVTDTESGIDGYYIYFGDSAVADPEASGSYQYTTNYTVSTAMTSGTTYYLLIKAKDKLGNVSDTVTGFTYVYTGISPATTTTLTTTQADWDDNEATKSAVYSGNSTWWNQNYLYRKQLTISPISYIGPNTVVKLTLDTAALQTAGKLRSDRKDWRVVYWNGNQFREIDQDYVDTSTTYFVLQKGINTYSIDTNYYVYYGNSGETTSPLNNMGGEKGGAKWGGGQSFDGGDYVRIPSVSNNLSKITIEGWFKYKNANSYRCLYGGASWQVAACIYSGQNYLTYWFNTSSGLAISNKPGGTLGSTQLETGKWYHFAETYDSVTGVYNAYVNGRLDYTQSGITGNVTVTGQQYIGYAAGYYLFGFLDEFRISNNIRYSAAFTPPTTKFTTDANTLSLYHFDEDPGQTLTDSSGNSNNGTLGSAATVDGADPTWTSGTLGLLFDGTNDYINLPVGLTTLINGKANLTIEGWFRHTTASGNRWLYGDGSTEQIAVGINGTNNTMMYKFNTAGSGQFSDGTGSTVLTPGTWYHFATVYDSTAGTFKTYINGQSDYSRDSLSGNVSATNQERLGGSATGYFSGYLSEIRVSDVARYTDNFTPSSGAFLTDANTLALYHLTENVGQNINDSSGRGFTGYLGLNNSVASDDPTWWVGQINLTAGTEENVPVSAADNGLTLQSLNDGSWAGNQLPSMPVGLRMYYGTSTYVNNVLYVLRGYNTKTFYKLDLATSIWTQLSDAPGLMYNGSSMVSDGAGNIYATQGQGYNLYKYNIATNTWSSSLTASTVLFSTGAVATMVGTDTIYIFAGAATSFLKYTISTDNWDNVSAVPYSVTAGSGIYYDGTNTIWGVMGGGSSFAKYIVNTDTWDYTVPLAPYTLGTAANNLIFYNNYLYSFSNYDYQSNTEEKRYLWRYGLANNKWESVPVNINFWTWTGATAYDGSRYAYLFQGYASSNASTAVARFDLLTNKFMPETPPLPVNRDYSSDGAQTIYQPYLGTSLAYDGSDGVYFVLGNSSRIDKYNTTTQKWSMIPFIPCGYYGGGTVYAGNYLYAVCGSNTMSMYRYNPISMNWVQMADAPGTIQAGGSQIAVWDNSDTIYVLRGNATQTLYKYSILDNTWTTESSTIPTTVGNSWGASITYDGSGNLFVVRGNDTNTFYKYNISTTTWTTLNNTGLSVKMCV